MMIGLGAFVSISYTLYEGFRSHLTSKDILEMIHIRAVIWGYVFLFIIRCLLLGVIFLDRLRPVCSGILSCYMCISAIWSIDRFRKKDEEWTILGRLTLYDIKKKYENNRKR